MRRLLLVALVVSLLGAEPAAAGVAVTNDRAAVTTKLGHKFVFHSRIENRGTTAATGLVAHLNVVDLTGHTYVDPEDWSSSRTRYLAPIAPGGATTLTWRLSAVNSGTIGVYVAVLPRSGAPVLPTTSPTVRVRITARRTLNSGGILPLALGIPGAIGLVALSLRYRRTHVPATR